MSAKKIKSLLSSKISNFEGKIKDNSRPIYKSSQCTKPQTTSFGCIGLFYPCKSDNCKCAKSLFRLTGNIQETLYGVNRSYAGM